MAPFEGPKSPLLSSVKHRYHLAITVVDVTFTKPSHFVELLLRSGDRHPSSHKRLAQAQMYSGFHVNYYEEFHKV